MRRNGRISTRTSLAPESGLKAQDVMQRRVIAVSPNATVREVAKLFVERKITGAPVVDRNRRVIGVISQTDLVRHDNEAPPVPTFYREGDQRLDRGLHLETPDYTRVRDIMTPAVFLAQEDVPVSAVARFMVRRHVHRVIVVRGEQLRGIITTLDVLRGTYPGSPRTIRRSQVVTSWR